METEKLTGIEGGSGGSLRVLLAREFAAFGPAYLRWLRSRVPEGGISYARMRLLSALRCGGPKIMSGLSGELGVTPRNVTALVDALEEEGLVRRAPHPTDRRATIIEMTPRGTRTCEGAFDDHSEAVAEVFDALSQDDQRELLRLLGELREALRRRGVAG